MLVIILTEPLSVPVRFSEKRYVKRTRELQVSKGTDSARVFAPTLPKPWAHTITTSWPQSFSRECGKQARVESLRSGRRIITAISGATWTRPRAGDGPRPTSGGNARHTKTCVVVVRYHRCYRVLSETPSGRGPRSKSQVQIRAFAQFALLFLRYRGSR